MSLSSVTVVVFEFKNGPGRRKKLTFDRDFVGLTVRQVIEKLDGDFEIPGLIRPFTVNGHPVGLNDQVKLKAGSVLRAYTLRSL